MAVESKGTVIDVDGKKINVGNWRDLSLAEKEALRGYIQGLRESYEQYKYWLKLDKQKVRMFERGKGRFASERDKKDVEILKSLGGTPEYSKESVEDDKLYIRDVKEELRGLPKLSSVKRAIKKETKQQESELGL